MGRAGLGQESPNLERWDSLRFVDSLLVPRSRQECVSAAVYRAKADDLARIVDALSALKIPARVLRDERVEIHRRFSLEDDGALVKAGIQRKADDHAIVVNG